MVADDPGASRCKRILSDHDRLGHHVGSTASRKVFQGMGLHGMAWSGSQSFEADEYTVILPSHTLLSSAPTHVTTRFSEVISIVLPYIIRVFLCPIALHASCSKSGNASRPRIGMITLQSDRA